MKKICIVLVIVVFLWSCTDSIDRKELDLSKAEYSGTDRCVNCHKAQEEIISQTAHWVNNSRSPYAWKDETAKNAPHTGCEACHGKGSLHVEAIFQTETGQTTKMETIQFGELSPIPISQQDEYCLKCHQRTFSDWQNSEHSANEVGCAGCHNVCGKAEPHRDKLISKENQLDMCGRCHLDKKAAMERVSHHPVREGKMKCTDCHDPHGTGGPQTLTTGNKVYSAANIAAENTTELCLKCHTEKRGPHLWEHPSVIEDCGNCHDPHGSIHDKLLTMSTPYLCQRCHSGTRHSGAIYTRRETFGGSDPTAQMFGRGCVNCHSRIHGSNHPSGRTFLK